MVLADVEKFTLVVCFTLEEAGSPEGNMHLINQWVGGARHIYQWKYICAANIQGGDSYIIGKPTYGICPDLPPPDVTFK